MEFDFEIGTMVGFKKNPLGRAVAHPYNANRVFFVGTSNGMSET